VKHNYQTNIKIRAAILFATLFWSLQYPVAQASDSTITPLPGDPLRQQLLDALRQEVKRTQGVDVVFVVQHLKVKDGWAWAHTSPQSLDGKNRYEDLSALLRLDNGNWIVAEIPCTEPENPECLEGPGYFEQLQKRYPTVAVEVFPEQAPSLED
jgi:hypothetical protein